MIIFKVTLHNLLFTIPHNLVYVIFAIGVNEEGNSSVFETVPGCKLTVPLTFHSTCLWNDQGEKNKESNTCS